MSSTLATPPHETPPFEDVCLPVSGWTLHVGRGSHNRPALEVHTGDGLIDIAVAGSLDATMLRGALRGRRPRARSAGARRRRASWALAWGHLPGGPAGRAFTVEFRSGRRARRVDATEIAGAFWFAEVPGAFRSVAISAVPTRPTSRAVARLRRYRP